MAIKEQLLKDGYRYLNGNKDVFIKVAQNGNEIETSYVKCKDNVLTVLKRLVSPNKTVHYKKTPSGYEDYLTIRKNSVTKERCGYDLPYSRKDIFFSKDMKNIDQIYYEWGGENYGKKVYNYKTNTSYDSKIPNNIGWVPSRPNPFNIGSL